jgi:membrane-bound lytic murein transglycosylase D
MIKKRKPSLSAQKTGDGFIGRLFAQTKLPAHVTEEQDWYMDTPDVRLTRVFTVVLILHVVAVGGILAFKMVEKASTPAVVAASDTTTGTDATQSSTAPAAPAKAQPEPAPAPAKVEDTAAKNPATSNLVDHPSAKGYGEYTVGDKETLAMISKKLNVSEAQIREANLIDGDQNLYPGRVLFVPASTGAAPAAPVVAQEPKKPTTAVAALPEAPAAKAPEPAKAKAVPAAPAVGPKPSNYQVQKGDTFYSISRKVGVKVQDLMAANGIAKAEHLQVGQTLKVPKN